MLTQRQVNIISAFYRLSQERELHDSQPLSIKDRDVNYYQEKNGSCSLPDDLFMIAIHEIDQEYIKHRQEEIRRRNNKG